MHIKFLGGVEGVTGSRTLLDLGSEKYFIDYGLYQGTAEIRQKNWDAVPMAKNIDAVFLTHAHIDHSGLLPRLVRDKFTGPVYCTRETAALCDILLQDAARIQEEDAGYINRKQISSHKPALPLYTQEDAEKILKQIVTLDIGEEREVSDLLSIRFHWAGHILGSSFLEINLKDSGGAPGKRIVFSGDVGHDRSVLLKGPENLIPTDVLILESTYGAKLHQRLPAIEILEIYLNLILKRGGVAILPAFSVGRTQEVLYLLNQLLKEKRIPDTLVVLDSPLSIKANEIFLSSLRDDLMRPNITKGDRLFPAKLRITETPKESRAINELNGPLIIVSASGMLDGGRVVHHLKVRLGDEKNGVILVGYQPEGAKGRRLLDGEKILRLHKEECQVKAEVFHINALSAHADYLDILAWLKTAETPPGFIIVNHGEPDSSRNLKRVIESQLGIKTTIAGRNEEFHL